MPCPYTTRPNNATPPAVTASTCGDLDCYTVPSPLDTDCQWDMRHDLCDSPGVIACVIGCFKYTLAIHMYNPLWVSCDCGLMWSSMHIQRFPENVFHTTHCLPLVRLCKGTVKEFSCISSGPATRIQLPRLQNASLCHTEHACYPLPLFLPTSNYFKTMTWHEKCKISTPGFPPSPPWNSNNTSLSLIGRF